MSITTNNGYNINLGFNGGTGNMLVLNSSGITCNSTLCTQKNQNSLVSYFQPNPQNGLNNTTSMTNLPSINLCAGAYTTGNAINPYLTVYCADSWNGFDTIVSLACNSGANAGYANGSRIILDGSYNANSSSGVYGSVIAFQSQNSSGWQTNMQLYTITSPVLTAALNVNGLVKSYGATLTSSSSIKSNIRDICMLH